MANWSLCGRHAGPDKSPTPIFINLDNVLTVERQGNLTTVIMVGGEKVYIDTMLMGACSANRGVPRCMKRTSQSLKTVVAFFLRTFA